MMGKQTEISFIFEKISKKFDHNKRTF